MYVRVFSVTKIVNHLFFAQSSTLDVLNAAGDVFILAEPFLSYNTIGGLNKGALIVVFFYYSNFLRVFVS